MLSRFLLGAIVGGIAVYVWGDEIRRFANTKGRTARLAAADTLKAVQSTAEEHVRLRERPGDLDPAVGSGRHPARAGHSGPVMSARAVVGGALVAATCCWPGAPSRPPRGAPVGPDLGAHTAGPRRNAARHLVRRRSIRPRSSG